VPVYFHDTFTGSGSLLGHVPDVSPAGAGWGDASQLQLVGGQLVSQTGWGNAEYTAFVVPGGDDATEAIRVTWVWTPEASSASLSDEYENPFSLELEGMSGSAAAVSYNDEGDGTRYLSLGLGEYPGAYVMYSAGTPYAGELIITPTDATLTFLGQTLTTPLSGLPVFKPMPDRLYLSGSMDYLKFESATVEAPANFWTGLRSAVEIA
jgi:hypothetical protein